MFDLNDCMAFVTSRSGKIFAAAMEKQLNQYHMTRTQWIAMYYILSKGPLTQKQLAEQMVLKEPSIVPVLQKLEIEGHLIRESSKEDRRVKYLELSESGRDLGLSLLPVVEQFKADTTAGIGEETLQLVKEALEKMTENAMRQL